MSGHKNLRPAPSVGQQSPSPTFETNNLVSELTLKNAQLTEKNAQLTEKNCLLAQEVQKLKQTNGMLMKRVIDLTRKTLEISSDNNRLKESVKRVSVRLQKFIPCMVSGMQHLDCMAEELNKAAESQPNLTNTSPVFMDEVAENVNGGDNAPVSPLRTGIARPIVQGHTICKPSISLQRVVPRQTATQYIPIRALNLADLVRADERNSPLNDVSEEDDLGSREENEGAEEGEGNETDDSQQETVVLDHGPADENEAAELSTIAEESVAAKSSMQLSVILERSAILSPIIEDQASTSQSPMPIVHKRKKKLEEPSVEPAESTDDEEVVRELPLPIVHKRKKKLEEPSVEPAESTDDEEVERELLKARCRLMNLDRRKELKEGTSKDYDARGNFSPSSRKKRRKKNELPPTEENETSAIRRSVDGLLNSINKSRVSLNKRVSDCGDSPLSRSVNGFCEDITNPRVSLVRMSEFGQPPVGSEANGLDDMVVEDVSAAPPSPVFMVFKRKRGSYVTTRNKKSRPAPVDDVVETVQEPTRHSVKRKSWAFLMKKRSRSQEEEELDSDLTENSPHTSPHTSPGRLRPSARSPRPSASSPGPEANSTTVDDLPTILLSRVSESFIALNSSKELPDSNLNDSTSSYDEPLSRLIPTAISENSFYSQNLLTGENAAKRAQPKPRSKPKRPSKPAKTTSGKQSRDSNRSVNGVNNESRDSETGNPSLSSSTVASSFDDRENSVGSPNRFSATGRPRRARAPTSFKEKPLNTKMRRT